MLLIFNASYLSPKTHPVHVVVVLNVVGCNYDLLQHFTICKPSFIITSFMSLSHIIILFRQLIMKKIFCLDECLAEEGYGNQKMIVNGAMTSLKS